MRRMLRRIAVRIQRPASRQTGASASVLSEVKAARMDMTVSIDDVSGVPVFQEKRSYQLPRDRKYPRDGARDDADVGASVVGAPMVGGGQEAGSVVVEGAYAAANRQLVDEETGETLRITGVRLGPRRRHVEADVEREGTP